MSAMVAAPLDAYTMEVSSVVEARLLKAGAAVSGASDSFAWSTPSNLWLDDAYRTGWYERARKYWSDESLAPPTVDGVLGGQYSTLDLETTTSLVLPAASLLLARDSKIIPQ